MALENLEDRNHAQALRGMYRRRLRLIELKLAEQGGDAPPALTIEAEDIRKRISDLDDALDPATPAADYDDLRRRYAHLDLIAATVGQFGQRLTVLEEMAQRLSGWLIALVVIMALEAILIVLIIASPQL